MTDGDGRSERSELANVPGNEVVDFNKWREELGITGKSYARGGKKKLHTYSISDEAYEGLKVLARVHNTFWGTQVSVSALIEAIGTGQLRVES